MADLVVEHHGVPVLVCDAEGAPIAGAQDALDHLVAPAFCRAEVVAVPAERFAPGFYDLRTGLAGEIFQKLANYRLQLAVVGDISDRLRASSALRDLVREVDRGRHVWFVACLDDLADRLGG
ncbi:DUF4180 domain-containing protein [Streptomyces sp. BE147]|uniref:DUF4180 domain-containing protein n=1 Tax=unclassified Streptomyces TaxID=2593676 RepID=UPI002E7A3AA4|nr:DUF4180 domain-containing protein [Streptomyces sp. BE147]MEE1737804.1 DUF4180 domain-containing protein [Streptomyces sp. BE147]